MSTIDLQAKIPNNVSLADNRLYKPSQVWADPESDVALMKLDAPDTLQTAVLGDSDRARVGQWVLGAHRHRDGP